MTNSDILVSETNNTHIQGDKNMANELKLTPQAIRKILNQGNMPKQSNSSNQLLNNQICVGKVNVITGITIRTLIKGEMIQVWAHTSNPKEDIKRASELLSNAGYVVETEGFQCIVKLS